MNPTDEVTLWKAPQKGRDGAAEVASGFDPNVYPGNGPYFAFARDFAEGWQDIYENGLQEIHLPRTLFEDLVQKGVIQSDSYCPGQSCHVPAAGLAAFNQAIQQGSPNVYHPQAT